MKVLRGAGVMIGGRVGTVHAGRSRKRRGMAHLVMDVSPLDSSGHVVIHTRAVAWSPDAGILVQVF